MVINFGEQMQKGQFKRRGRKNIKEREREREREREKRDKIAPESKEGLFGVLARK